MLRRFPLTHLALVLAFTASLVIGRAQIGADGGSGPRVSIAWPTRADDFRTTELIKIEAAVMPADSPIAFVQFYADTNLIATATNPPFAPVWRVQEGPSPRGLGTWRLTAVAGDTSGGRGESAPVDIHWDDTIGPMVVLRILSPPDGTVFSAPATFTFSAELVASEGDAGPVQFYIGTNSVGVVTQAVDVLTVDTPPYSLAVTNLAEGQYALSAAYLGQFGGYRFDAGTVRVTKLGIQSPSLRPDGRVQFGVVTSFPGKPTVIKSSPDLVNWSSIATNVPPTNTFTFTDPSPATNGTRFYRAVIPSQ